MKVKMLLFAAALSCLAMADSASAQVRYGQPTYRGTTRAVHYSRSTAMMGEDCGCAAQPAACTSCGGCGCGHCCRGILGWVAGGVGRVADGLGATLDCLFPGGACCESSCCERPCCARRPACGTRACMRRGCEAGCDAGCGGCGADEWADGEVIEDHVPATKSPSPAPTPMPDTDAKESRHYRPVPPTRTTYSKPRSAATSRPNVRTPNHPTVRASAEEEVAPAARAPRTLMVRPADAKRIVPTADEVFEEPAPAPTAVRSASRVPANPLRSR